MKPSQIRKAYAAADKALNDYAEKEMYAIMQAHPSIECLLKCMGDLTAYAKGGRSFDNLGCYGDKPPKRVQKLEALLDELDHGYNVRTGYPLRLTRQPDGTITAKRDW